MSVYAVRMPNKTIYVKNADQQLWADTEAVAGRTGRSVSEIIADGLRLFHAQDAAANPEPWSAKEYVPPSRREPAPDPFAAKD